MDEQQAPGEEQASLMAELECDGLRSEIKALRQELAELRAEADLDSCHIAGLSAQIKALIAESDACGNKSAHPLVERENYTDSRTGQKINKTKALPIYRAAFDAEAKLCHIEHPERFRS